MSYSTFDRFGGSVTKFKRPSGGLAVDSGTLDFGFKRGDFSFLVGAHPTEQLFDNKFVKPSIAASSSKSEPCLQPRLAQFRHPAPAREAMLQAVPGLHDRMEAHRIITRKTVLNRLALRQKALDRSLSEAPHFPPVRMSVHKEDGPQALFSSTALGSASLTIAPGSPEDISTVAASEVSRDVYTRHGWLGKSRGSTTSSTMSSCTRGASSEDRDTPALATSSRRSAQLQRKPRKQWRVCPENSFALDPLTFLPVPKPGPAGQKALEWEASRMEVIAAEPR